MESAACGRFKQTAGVAYICQLCINYDVCVSGERGVRGSGKGKRGAVSVQGAWRQNYLPHLRPKACSSYVKL